MPFYKDHCGQYHKANIAFAALTSLYVIGAAVALSSPYWASSYPALAPLAAFAATPLGIGILATVSVALIGLAVYAISKNNKVSEEKAPKVTKDGLLVRRDVYEKMKENNKNKNKEGQLIDDEYYIDFFKDKNYRVIVGDKPTQELGNTLLFEIDSLKVKNDKGEHVLINNKPSEELGLDKEGAKEVNTYLGELSSVQPASGKGRS
ncbi:MAG: hypothetical protein LJD31_00850 [Wolbachia endosymbiont of Menacanthus eurysternus]|nr:hypothetical protein [Wolbachia endosymbiont of Menacanthus eurysternus]